MDDGTKVDDGRKEIVKAIYAAINRNDIAALTERFDPDVEWTEPAERPGGGNCKGRAEVKALFAKSRATWAEGGCEPERMIVAGDQVVALVHVRVRLAGQSEWLEGDVTDVWTFRDGRVIAGRSFDDRQAALRWAGVGEGE
jgi:ketosteroid isomerase-like protein